MHASAQPGQRLALAQQISRSGRAQRDDDLGPHHIDLPEEERRAGIGLFRLGGAIAGRTALDHVGDVDLFALQAHGRDHVVEQLPGAAHERQSLRVFVGAGAFADEHQARVGRAVGKHDLVAALVQGAARAVADVFADEAQGGGFVGGLDFGRISGWRGNRLAGRNGFVLLKSSG